MQKNTPPLRSEKNLYNKQSPGSLRYLSLLSVENYVKVMRTIG